MAANALRFENLDAKIEDLRARSDQLKDKYEDNEREKQRRTLRLVPDLSEEDRELIHAQKVLGYGPARSRRLRAERMAELETTRRYQQQLAKERSELEDEMKYCRDLQQAGAVLYTRSSVAKYKRRHMWKMRLSPKGWPYNVWKVASVVVPVLAVPALLIWGAFALSQMGKSALSALAGVVAAVLFAVGVVIGVWYGLIDGGFEFSYSRHSWKRESIAFYDEDIPPEVLIAVARVKEKIGYGRIMVDYFVRWRDEMSVVVDPFLVWAPDGSHEGYTIAHFDELGYRPEY